MLCWLCSQLKRAAEAASASSPSLLLQRQQRCYARDHAPPTAPAPLRRARACACCRTPSRWRCSPARSARLHDSSPSADGANHAALARKHRRPQVAQGWHVTKACGCYASAVVSVFAGGSRGGAGCASPQPPQRPTPHVAAPFAASSTPSLSHRPTDRQTHPSRTFLHSKALSARARRPLRQRAVRRRVPAGALRRSRASALLSKSKPVPCPSPALAHHEAAEALRLCLAAQLRAVPAVAAKRIARGLRECGHGQRSSSPPSAGSAVAHAPWAPQRRGSTAWGARCPQVVLHSNRAQSQRALRRQQARAQQQPHLEPSHQPFSPNPSLPAL